MNLQNLKLRYSALDLKAKHEPLTDREQNEVENIQRIFEIKPCDQCEGEGYFYNPSILGYGYEEGACTKCQGLGELGHPEDLKEMLLEHRE